MYREAVKHRMRARVRAGRGLPKRPKPATLWEAANGDGLLAVVLMLEFDVAKREVRQEIADGRSWYRAA